MESIDFIKEIAILAEQKNHHPDIFIGWCKVDISITSHDLGGVTTNCVNLALGIDSISNKIKENEINLYAYINFLVLSNT